MITFDFESRSVLNLNKSGAYKYADHPRTQVLCAAWLYDDSPVVGHWHRHTTGQGEWDPVEQSPDDVLDELIQRIEDGEPIEAHNAYFEYVMWTLCWKRELPFLPIPKDDQWFCSAAKAASFSLPRKLEVVADVLKVAERKDMVGHAIMKKLSRPARPTKANPDRRWYEDPRELRRNWQYNIQDCRAEKGVSGSLRDLGPTERRIWLMDQGMNRRGIHCDVDLVQKAADMAASEVAAMNARIAELTDGAVPKGSSRVKLKAWAKGKGTALPDTAGKTIQRLLRTEEMRDDVSEVLGLSMDVNKTSTAKYAAMLERICSDSRLRDLMIYCGAERTGRWAGAGVQPHNFPRGSVKDMTRACEAILTGDPEIVRFLFGSIMEHLSGSIRGAIRATPGKDLMVADYAAIEARDVFWLAGDEAGLDEFRASDAGEGPEVYCVMAGQIYGYAVNADDHPQERFVGKQSILGAGFGMGWERYMDQCAGYGVKLEEKTCRLAIDTYREVHEPVKIMWDEQEAAAKNAVRNKGSAFKCGKVLWAVRGQFLHCRLPSGRLLSYHKPRISRMFNYRFHVLKDDGARKSTISINQGGPSTGEYKSLTQARWRAKNVCEAADWELLDKEPFVREQSVLRYDGIDPYSKKWKRGQETYGGKLVENITQAVARDQIAEAMLRADDDGLYDVLLSVHDELICEVDKDKGDLREFELMMAENPAWSPDVPLVAKGWRGERYRK